MADDLAVFRAERLVFARIGFSLAPGQAMLLSGANGSGKSSLLRLLAGLLRPAAGTLTWQGRDALADLVEHAARLAYLGHQEAIKPALSVASNLALRAPRPARVAALAALGLQDLADLPARLLSAGQRRRLALARLLLRPAPLWLLDEPTLGLDHGSVARLGTVARQHLDRGGMIIAATHLPLPLPDAFTLALGGAADGAPDRG